MTSSATRASSAGLVAAYAFDEGSGTRVTDVSGLGNTGTTQNTTWSTAGRFGGALSFNGSSSSVSVPDSSSLDISGAVTLEAWVRPASTMSTSWKTVAIKEQTGDLVYGLYANSDTSRPVGVVYRSGAEADTRGTSELTAATWTHIATTWDGATLRMYVNGTQVSSKAVTGSMPASTGALRIGGNSVWGEWFSGLIDDVRIYNRALPAAEISSDMSTPVATPAPDATAPSAPSGLTATSATATSIATSWTASSDNVGVTGYRLYNGGAAAGTTSSTTYTFTGLTCGTSYTLAVEAYDAAGNVSTRPSITTSTAACGDTTPPSAPGGLAQSAASTTTVSVAWQASTDNVGVAGYDTLLNGASRGSVAGTSTTMSGLTCGTAYTVGIVAYDAAGNRSGTSSVSAATQACSAPPSSPTPVPAANAAGVTVGSGFLEASSRQVVRTAGNVVYVITADDNPCQGSGSGVIRIEKGLGAQPGNAAVPTSFVEQDSANHPVSAGSSTCQYSPATSVLFSPDSRLDRSGTIHLAYIDTANGTLYYQTFSTVSNNWGPRVVLATNALRNSGSGWPRGGQVALTLDSNDVPTVVYTTGGTSNGLVATTRAGGVWSPGATVATGTDLMHPSIVTALDGSLHVAWLESSLAAHATVRYSRYDGVSWSAPETVSSGDSVVLGNGNDDQGPSVATDLQSRPHVLYLDGTVNGSDNYVRMRVRTASGTWSDNTPPGGAGGASNPAGTWYTHTPQNYVSSSGTDFVFLGHDVSVSPGGYEYQGGGFGNPWSAYSTLDPRNQTNTTAGAPGLDGSASVRFDPLRDNNPGIIDVLYYDENDGTAGYPHHATIYYKAVVIGPPDTTAPSTPSGLTQTGATKTSATLAWSASTDDVGVTGYTLYNGSAVAASVTSPSGTIGGLTCGTTYTAGVEARDAAGNRSGRATLSVTTAACDSQPPTVSVTAPAGGSTVSSTTTVTASAADDVGVVGVQFMLDGAPLGTEDTVAPWSVSWTTTSVADGSHTLTAVARDASGKATTSAGVTVMVTNAPPTDTTPPTVAFSAPAAGSTVSASITISASGSDNVGVAGVQFRVDGAALGAEDTVAPYSTSWDTRNVTDGTHTLTATARDAAGNVATATESVTVANAVAPPPSTITVTKVFEGADTDNTTHYFALTRGVPAGDTILLVHASTVDATDGSGGIVTPNGVSDPRGNAWAQDAVSHPGTSFSTLETWSAYVSTTLQAGDRIRVNGYPRGLSDEIAIFDVHGLAGTSQASRLDQRAGSAAYSKTQSTPYVTTTQAHELLVGVHGVSSTGWVAEAQTPPWSKLVDRYDGGNIARGLAVVMREVTATGAYRSRGTAATTSTQNNLIVTYKGN